MFMRTVTKHKNTLLCVWPTCKVPICVLMTEKWKP